MRYPWPDGQQCAVVLSFDFDAESGFLFREPEKAKWSLGGLEERRFGPRVGVDRILRMLDRLRVPASFFIPGWTVENHHAESTRIRDAGHEIGAHGNVHEAVGFLDREQEEAVMRQQLYDSSLMGNDVPYTVETEHGPLVEVPVQWLLDDAPLFRHVYGATNAIADPARVFDLWSREFAGMHRENACFILTCHPFISGRASRVMILEELVAYMRRFRGVWFTTCEGVARWHAERRPTAGAPERAGRATRTPRGRSARPRRPGR
jgi:peptidoglycan/xylan/chitin deacetylase (PgdA/CDA1 family)